MPALVVYAFFWVILLAAANYATGTFNRYGSALSKNVVLWGVVVLMALLIGLRWEGYGSDYNNYYAIITGEVEVYELDRLELLSRLMIVVFNALGLPFFTWFVVMAFLQLFFLVKAADNGLQALFPWMVLVFFLNLFPLSLILIRQVTAVLILLYAYTFIPQRKLLPFLLLVALATGFHLSSLIAIPLYWIAPRVNIKSIGLQLAVVGFLFFFGWPVVQLIWSLIARVSFRYAEYFGRQFNYGTRSGIGVILAYLRYFFLILYSNRLKEKYKDQGFSVFYLISFVFICFYNVIKEDQMLSRASMIFSVADMVTLGFFFHYLFRSRKNDDKLILGFMLALIVVTLVYTAMLSNPWHFFWQIPSLRQ